jgi:hypothetical protein
LNERLPQPSGVLLDHRPCGTLKATATEPAWNGYVVTVACSRGVVFARWVLPQDAREDLILFVAACEAELKGRPLIFFSETNITTRRTFGMAFGPAA